MKPTMRITIDSYIRVKKAALRAAGLTVREVRERFEHPNPDYWKKQRMGHWVGSTPRVLTLIESTPEELLLPRGGWGILNRLLRDRGVDVEISSETVSGTGPLGYVYAEPSGWTLGPDQTAAARMAVLGKQGILLGPCSCLQGSTEIFDPVDGSTRTIGERFLDNSPFHVISWDGNGFYPALALPPVAFAPCKLVELETEAGTLCVTPDHLIWTGVSWARAGALATFQLERGHLPRSAPYLLPSILVDVQRVRSGGDPRCSGTPPGSLDGCRPALRSCDAPPLPSGAVDVVPAPSPTGAQEPTFAPPGGKPERSHPWPPVAPSGWRECDPVAADGREKTPWDGSSSLFSGVPREPGRGRSQLPPQPPPGSAQIHTVDLLLRDARPSRVASAFYSNSSRTHITCTEGLSRILRARWVSPERYYDFCVPETGNYVAGGHLHHNSGKTEILLKAISDIGERTLVIVHTERILRDWVKSAANRFFVPEGEIGVLYGRAKRVKMLTVGMVRTALNYVRRDPEFARRWGCVVLDEAHHSPASTFAELINSFPARWRLAATATPKRKDGKEGLFYDAFGAVLTRKRGGGLTTGPRVLFEITDADLDRFGRIVPVDVVVVPTDFAFDVHHAERMEREGFDRGDRSALSAVKAWAAATGYAGPLNTYADMLDAMTRDPARRARILEYLRPEVAAGQTCLLLADRREAGLEMEAHLRREGVEVGRLMGGRDSKRQEQTAAGLGDGSLRVAVATTIADEGMNIPRLSRGYGCTPTAGNAGRLTQQVGRFKRKFPGKVDAVYFYFWDARVRGLRGHAREVTRIIGHPHRVWFSERPGERVPLDRNNLAEIEARYNGGNR